MRIAYVTLITALAAGAPGLPAQAQSDDQPLSESIEQMFRELMDAVGPTIDELSETFDVLEQIDSLEHYERPEILENGDIIIRRREGAPPLVLPEDDEGPGVRT